MGGGVVGLLLNGAGPTADAKPPEPAPQADSARFVLNFPLHPEHNGEVYFGQVVYCGVATDSEPFRFDLVASNPPNLSIPEDSHEPVRVGP